MESRRSLGGTWKRAATRLECQQGSEWQGGYSAQQNPLGVGFWGGGSNCLAAGAGGYPEKNAPTSSNPARLTFFSTKCRRETSKKNIGHFYPFFQNFQRFAFFRSSPVFDWLAQTSFQLTLGGRGGGGQPSWEVMADWSPPGGWVPLGVKTPLAAQFVRFRDNHGKMR